MIRPVAQSQAPSFPTLAAGKKYEDIRENLMKLVRYSQQLTGPYLNGLLSQILNQINTQVQGVGAVLVSGATLIPTNAIHHVSGTATITHINAPAQFSGPIFLIPDGAWALATGGNIGKASTAVVGRLMTVVYDYTTWYPSY